MIINTNDPYSPNTRRVADAFWRACLGEPQTFKSDMKALAAALRTIVHEYGTSREDEWLIDANDLLDIADELEDNAEVNDD
jgi:uncharacterized membrane protein YdfJ with MMPL/SSD domain